MYNAEKEKRLLPEADLAKVRGDFKELEDKHERAKSSRQGAERALEAVEREKDQATALAKRRRAGVRALAKQFTRTLDMLKAKARGTRVQAVRDFLAS